MAAGLVAHNITTAASGGTFTVISWVPDTAAPDVGAVPVARLTDGVRVANISVAGALAVDALTVPADPFGLNADAASISGSISAKLRALATAVGTGVLTRGAGLSDANTLRVVMASDQLEQGKWIACGSGVTTPLQITTAAVGDFLSSITIAPSTVNPGTLVIKDGSSIAWTFPGGTLSSIAPFTLGLGWTSRLAGGWSVVLGSNITATCAGNFS